MNDLRAIIRELLREEIAALRAELFGGAVVERVAVGTAEQLTAFALDIARQARDPDFFRALEAGQIRYAPAAAAPASVTAAVPPAPGRPAPAAGGGAAGGGGAMPPPAVAPAPSAPMTLVTTAPRPVPELRKSLVTERDIAALAEGETRLRITKNTRLTPLASDEARRRGIRIERTLA